MSIEDLMCRVCNRAPCICRPITDRVVAVASADDGLVVHVVTERGRIFEFDGHHNIRQWEELPRIPLDDVV